MELREELLAILESRLERFGITKDEIRDDFDLVRSGLVSSLEFVEVMAEMERRRGVEIDYEKAIAEKDFTSVSGMVRIFQSYTDA